MVGRKVFFSARAKSLVQCQALSLGESGVVTGMVEVAEVMGEMVVEGIGLEIAEKMTEVEGRVEFLVMVGMTEVKMGLEEMVAMALVTVNTMEVMVVVSAVTVTVEAIQDVMLWMKWRC